MSDVCPKPIQSQPLSCDPTSAFVLDLCNTICKGSNDLCCNTNCANDICRAEFGAQSITGYIWGILKAFYRVNSTGLQQIPTILKSKPKNIILVTGLLIFIPMWILFGAILLILAITGIISWGIFFFGLLIGFIIVGLFILILFMYIENQITTLETDISNALKPYRSPDLGTQIGNQFLYVPAPKGYPCDT